VQDIRPELRRRIKNEEEPVVRYIATGIVGMALALFGAMRSLYPLVALGVVLIFAAFFWFARTNQGSPAPAKDEESMPRA
jgi:hypothetical protein